MILENVFGVEHVTYLIICTILFTISFYLINKIKDNEKIVKYIIKISAFILLVLITTNRIAITYYEVVVNKTEGYNWSFVIPSSWCGMTSLLLALSLLFLKKDNPVLHFVCYLGIFGGPLSVLYPYFIKSQGFFEIRSLTGLFHHTLMFWLIIVSIMTGYFKPTIKKCYYYPIGFTLMLLFGLFELKVLHFPTAMQLDEPLVSGALITSWYIVAPASFVGILVALFIIECFKQKSLNK